MKKDLSLILIFILFVSCSQLGKTPLYVFTYGDLGSPGGIDLKDFGKKYPHADIHYKSAVGENYHRLAKVLINADEVPHIMYLWSTVRSHYVYEASLNLDQRNYLNLEKFDERVLKPQGPNGEIWEIPLTLGVSSILFINKSVLEKYNLAPPSTYEQWVYVSRVLRENGILPVVMGGKDAWTWGALIFSTVVGRYAGDSWILAG